MPRSLSVAVAHFILVRPMHAPLFSAAATILVALTTSALSATESKILHLSPVVGIDLVGRSEYRIHGTRDMIPPQQLRAFLTQLCSYARGESSRSIVLYSYDLPPPQTIVETPARYAPILAIAREYGLAVYVIHPDLGVSVMDTYYRVIQPPSKRRPR